MSTTPTIDTTPPTDTTPKTTPATDPLPPPTDTTPKTTPATDPLPSTDPSDQDTKSGKCVSNDINCYLTEDYWKNMDAEAEGPIVNFLKDLPADLRRFFQSEKETVVSHTEASGLEWTKITEANFDTSQYVELDNTELESKMIISAKTDPTKITFTEEKFDNIALKKDEINDKTLVILENGDMYLPKVTVSDKIETDVIITVNNLLEFIGIISTIVFVLIFAALIFKKKPQKPQVTLRRQMQGVTPGTVVKNYST